MNCKECRRIIERAIEGELICASCWARAQMSDEDLACDEAMREYEAEKEYEAICPDCGTLSETIEFCWSVEDVIMQCPKCGYWPLFSGDAGLPEDSDRSRPLRQYEQKMLTEIYREPNPAAEAWEL